MSKRQISATACRDSDSYPDTAAALSESEGQSDESGDVESEDESEDESEVRG